MKVEDIASQAARELSAKYGSAVEKEVERALGPPTRAFAEATLALEMAHFVLAVTPFVVEIWKNNHEESTSKKRSMVAAEVMRQFDSANDATSKKFENMDDDVKKDVVDAAVTTVSKQR